MSDYNSDCFLVGAFPLREKCPTLTVASFIVAAFLGKSARLLHWLVFLVGAFLEKSARLLQWLVFFLFFSSDYNLTLIGPLFLQSKLLKLLA